MKKFRFSFASIIACLAVVVTLCSANSKRFVTAYYTQSNLGSWCNTPTTLPLTCTPVIKAQLCTTPFGSLTRTWYQDECETPYYRQP